jgi:hypothetical protein
MEPVRKRVTPAITNTKPAEQPNQIGGLQPHSPQTTPEVTRRSAVLARAYS